MIFAEMGIEGRSIAAASVFNPDRKDDHCESES